MTAILILPFALQAVLILVDEFYFHWRRGLPDWEIWGHPLDTFFSLLPFLFAAMSDPTQSRNWWIYGGLAAWSSVFITKDEFVHSELCPVGESWLHSVLFVMHPLTYVAAAWIWIHRELTILLPAQTALMFFFMLYQIVTWGILWRSRPRTRPAGR